MGGTTDKMLIVSEIAWDRHTWLFTAFFVLLLWVFAMLHNNVLKQLKNKKRTDSWWWRRWFIIDIEKKERDNETQKQGKYEGASRRWCEFSMNFLKLYLVWPMKSNQKNKVIINLVAQIGRGKDVLARETDSLVTRELIISELGFHSNKNGLVVEYKFFGM